jgi:dTDP-4-amino-4,6-dideoxygalactose transaminase
MSDATKLAMLGGPRAVPSGRRPLPWPLVTDEDRYAVNRVLDSGRFTSASPGEPEIPALEEEWAAACGVRHCVAVSSGTAALGIALAAADVRPGDEVVVPALSFIATALAPLHLGAVPVFVDVDPDRYNLDPAAFAAAVTDRTRAVIPVHLHGVPADMDEIRAIAAARGVAVIEDAAQAHGVAYRGRRVGGLASAAAFSLNVSKNLPTCGEGGLLTTDDADLAELAVMMRQFGERIPATGERAYLSRVIGWNAKMSAIQAAFTRSQLSRFAADQDRRHDNVSRFLARLADLPGLRPPSVPPDRGHAWHILRFRADPAELDLAPALAGPLRAAITRALRAEGVPVARYQSIPLPDQPLFRRGAGEPGREPAPSITAPIPVTAAVIEDSFTLQKAHLHPDAGPLLDLLADGFEKVWEHRELLVRMATGSVEAEPRPTKPERAPATPAWSARS